MAKLLKEVLDFFAKQNCVLVTTIDKNGFPHSSCKGLLRIEDSGKVILLDLYQGKTFENLKNNPSASITAFDEHEFKGFCLKGRARLLRKEALSKDILKAWEEKINRRIATRLFRNIREEKGYFGHPEARLPQPEYLIELKVSEVVDLTPENLKKTKT